MNVSDYDFELPEELIAQHPIDRRDHARMLIVDKKEDSLHDAHFYDILSLLDSDDVLIINDSKVMPARLIGTKVDTHAVIEVLLLKERDKNVWEATTRPARRVRVGTTLTFGDRLRMRCIATKEEGMRVFELQYDGLLIERLEELGTMPLPPYIKEALREQDRYQTVYAREMGSAAAPTAGLHFTKELLARIRKKGVTILPITLHVGLGTFKPISASRVEQHTMHSETYTISKEVAKALNDAKRERKRIIAVGTTSVRTLESNFNDGFHPGTFETDIFIYPGYRFRVIDGLITNFHLPKSTLIMLVSALAGKSLIERAYAHAIESRYRFFSFGDAMFIKTV
ncbi:MAG: tRNA preQ1(34) S-adenosylmethionine ribosyltransferase-isomerase QueA [Acholeplasmataceae bacterium]